VNIELFSPECAIKASFWDKYYFKLFIPLILSAVVLLLLVGKIVLLEKFPHIAAKFKLQKFKFAQKLTGLFSFMVVGFYTLLISTVVQPFNCTKQPDGSFTLTKAPSLKCFDSAWNQHLPVIVLFFILYGLSIPLVMIFLFYRNKNRIFTTDFKSRYDALISPYRPRFFYFEIVIMLKRALFVISNDFLSVASYSARYFSGFATLIFFFWLDILILPFQNKNFNLLANSYVM
jgi:hypothetical protein